MSEEGATVNSNNDQSNKEGMIINTDHIAMMPPLPDVTTPSRARRKPPNSYAFKLNNTVRIESISNKKLKLGKEGYIQHPVSLECYKKFLNQSNIKKIPEDNQDGFRQQMSMFLDDKKKFRCYSQNHNKHTKCTCVQSLLSIDSNKRICIDVVTSFWQLHLNTRNEIFSNKVYNIMDSKVTSTMAEPSSMKFRGKLFNVKGKFIDPHTNKTMNSYNFCLYGYLSLYGIGYYELQSLKRRYSQVCFDEHSMVTHGLKGKKGNSTLNDELYDSLRQFFEELSQEGDDYSSRQVRRAIGTAYLRDNELDGIRLPPSYSKRMIYEKWCFSRGWIVGRGGSDGSIGSISKFRKRPYDELDWPSGTEYKTVCAKSTFMTFWKLLRSNLPVIF